jgi:hypothetical protein
MRALKTAGAVSFITIFLYFNAVALCTTLNLRFKPIVPGYGSILPSHWIPQSLFRVWDVFDRWSTFNLGYKAFGSYEQLNEPPMDPETSLVDLDIYSYFPYIRGEANRRLWMVNIRNNKETRLRYQSRLLGVVKRLYNEKHADKPIKQAFLYFYTWPKSPEGWGVGFENARGTVEAIN